MLRSTDERHRPIIALQILADFRTVVHAITDWQPGAGIQVNTGEQAEQQTLERQESKER